MGWYVDDETGSIDFELTEEENDDINENYDGDVCAWQDVHWDEHDALLDDDD